MMSRKDALRSYRRAFRRAYPIVGPALAPTHPLQVEMGKRGDRLQRVFGFSPQCVDYDDYPAEVVDAMTARDLEYLASDDDGVCPF
jgi:hypothetical protein